MGWSEDRNTGQTDRRQGSGHPSAFRPRGHGRFHRSHRGADSQDSLQGIGTEAGRSLTPQQIPITTASPCFSSAIVLRANEQRVLLGFARFARTLLAAIASKGQAAGRDFARLLAVGLPLRMTLLVCSQAFWRKVMPTFARLLARPSLEPERRQGRWRAGADD